MSEALDRDALGQLVRTAWVAYCIEISDTTPSHVAPWEALSERDKEADRRIGEVVASHARAITRQEWRGYLRTAIHRARAMRGDLASAQTRERVAADAYARQQEAQRTQEALLSAMTERALAAEQERDVLRESAREYLACSCSHGVHWVDVDGEAEAESCELRIILDDQLRAFDANEHPGAALHSELLAARALADALLARPGHCPLCGFGKSLDGEPQYLAAVHGGGCALAAYEKAREG